MSAVRPAGWYWAKAFKQAHWWDAFPGAALCGPQMTADAPERAMTDDERDDGKCCGNCRKKRIWSVDRRVQSERYRTLNKARARVRHYTDDDQ